MATRLRDRSLTHPSPARGRGKAITREDEETEALVHADLGYDEGAFVFLAPEGNLASRRAITKYRNHLTRDDTFLTWSLEQVVAPFRSKREPTWCHQLVDRYLAFMRVELCAKREAAGPCPACGQAGVPVLYGEGDDIAVRMAARGELVLAGCCIPPEPFSMECAGCGRGWGAE